MSHTLLLHYNLFLFCDVDYFSCCTLPLWMLFILPLKKLTMFSFIFQWNVPEANTIISITGGAMVFQLDRELTAQFKKGLIKTASDTGAWIVTGSTVVMKYVGAAVTDQASSEKRSRSGATLRNACSKKW